MKTKHLPKILLLIPAILLATANCGAATLSFQNGVNAYSGALEVALEENKDKLPESINIWTCSRNADGKVISYKQVLVKFQDIFGKGKSQIPRNAKITKATLTLCTGKMETAPTKNRIYLHRMLVAWDKNTSWKNAFGKNGVQANDKEALSASDAHFNPDANSKAYEIDVTESLRAWASGQDNHGWVLLDISKKKDNFGFISSRLKTPGRRPLLTVVYE